MAWVTRVIPGQNLIEAAVVHLDEPISVDGVVATVKVLEYPYEGEQWSRSGAGHLEPCDFERDAAPWQIRRRGAMDRITRDV